MLCCVIVVVADGGDGDGGGSVISKIVNVGIGSHLTFGRCHTGVRVGVGESRRKEKRKRSGIRLAMRANKKK